MPKFSHIQFSRALDFSHYSIRKAHMSIRVRRTGRMSTGGRAPRKLTKEEEEERKETCKRLAKEREQRMIILAAARKAKREENLRKREERIKRDIKR